MIQSSGDQRLVGFEGRLHDALESGEIKIRRIRQREEDGENIDATAIFFLRQPSAVVLRQSVQCACECLIVARRRFESFLMSFAMKRFLTTPMTEARMMPIADPSASSC